ncbi:DUF5689 domain-containing protein [Winogradskyella tangerina]|uniref:DUF5689 domain-containing protein n=1 Tax=Winogradskyella tangerina TaxID=2023240 RepID=UPI0013006F6B|nr:DUF5689 domain-containing protein [Winogradskyella tangerina]
MKTLKINKLILLFVGLIVFNSCVEDDDFDTPNTAVEEPVLTGPVVQISSLAGELAQEQGNGSLDYTDEETTFSYTFNENDLFMEGYVVSSDEGGNFFEEIIIQDNFENPTIGIKLLIDVNPLFIRYEPGRKVYVKLNGLAVGITNGVLSLGALNGNEVDKIPSALENDVIFRSAEVQTLVPMPLAFADFADDKTNLFVQLQDVQFNRNIVGDNALTYASEPSDEFDGERTLESCAGSSSVIFSTSTFADFKGLTLPAGRGNIDAILSKDFFGEVFNINVNTPEDVNLTSTDRCDPEFLECTGASGGGAAIFEEDFEGFGTYASEGWDNINISGTDTDWFISSFSGNFYSRISAFSSGNTEADVWLVTPSINMDGTTGEELSFDVQANFDNGTNLSAWVSTDYAGDPTTATWTILDATIPVGPASTFGNFETVGPINISCVDGDMVIGFFYEGSDPSATTRYHVDNVIVTGN